MKILLTNKIFILDIEWRTRSSGHQHWAFRKPLFLEVLGCRGSKHRWRRFSLSYSSSRSFADNKLVDRVQITSRNMVSPWSITSTTHSVQITCLLVSLLVTCNQLVKVLTTTLPTKPANLTITQNIFVPSILWRKEVQCMLITQTRVSYSCSTPLPSSLLFNVFISFRIFYSHFLRVNTESWLIPI